MILAGGSVITISGANFREGVGSECAVSTQRSVLLLCHLLLFIVPFAVVYHTDRLAQLLRNAVALALSSC